MLICCKKLNYRETTPKANRWRNATWGKQTTWEILYPGIIKGCSGLTGDTSVMSMTWLKMEEWRERAQILGEVKRRGCAVSRCHPSNTGDGKGIIIG